MDPLQVTDLNAFYGKAHVLHGITFSAAPGVVIGILGRNGAGKTTLLKAIMGLDATTSGEVTVLGQSATKMSTDAIARLGVAYMPQDVRVFPLLSVRENISVAANAVARPKPLAEILAMIPELEPMLGRAAGTLSGGQKQLVGIARSLSMRCRVLLMDEPTEGLMPRLVTQVGSIVRSLAAEGVSVVLVEQNIGLVTDICDSVFIMEKGQMKWHGKASEVVPAGVLDRYMGVNVGDQPAARRN
ncbi:MAG: ABC transporter ATP-binding protein [Parvibaculaceae bacterium]